METGERQNVLVSPAAGWRQSQGVFHGNRLCGRQRGYRSGCVSCVPCAPTFLLPVTQPTHPPPGWMSTARASRFSKRFYYDFRFFLVWHDFDTGLHHILLKGCSTLLTCEPSTDRLSSRHIGSESFCRETLLWEKCDWFWDIMTMTHSSVFSLTDMFVFYCNLSDQVSFGGFVLYSFIILGNVCLFIKWMTNGQNGSPWVFIIF